jgi:Tfp pilus assembly protein FimT
MAPRRSLLRPAVAPVDQQGLTAVELVTVLVLVALLGFAAYPLLSSVRETMLVKGAAEQTAAAVRLARQLAITQGSDHCIEFGLGGAQYRIRQADTTTTCGGPVVAGYDWQALSDSESVASTAPTLIFDPIGNRIFPVGPGSTTFNVDTVPPSCLSMITVTLYGGVRVAGC